MDHSEEIQGLNDIEFSDTEGVLNIDRDYPRLDGVTRRWYGLDDILDAEYLEDKC